MAKPPRGCLNALRAKKITDYDKQKIHLMQAKAAKANEVQARSQFKCINWYQGFLNKPEIFQILCCRPSKRRILWLLESFNTPAKRLLSVPILEAFQSKALIGRFQLLEQSFCFGWKYGRSHKTKVPRLVGSDMES